MNLPTTILIVAALIGCSAFFSCAEISLAAARKFKLQLLVDSGNRSAARVLAFQAQPGHFFTVVQIALNAVAILAGILSEAVFSPHFVTLLALLPEAVPVGVSAASVLSFLLMTSLFILIADLIPKRLAMIAPERVALATVSPMLFCVRLFKPLVWVFNGLADLILRLCKLPTARSNDITADDLLAMMDAGATAGVLQKQEQNLIENVLELESRTASVSMTQREDIIYFSLQENEAEIRRKIAEQPHTSYLVCTDEVDSVLGYVDAKDILMRLLNGKTIALSELTMHTVLAIPETLTLSEVLDRFKGTREDFAVVLNEYARVVGVITLNDVMATLMGDISSPSPEDQIVRRDEKSWLIDGVTPVQDVQRALDIEDFPDSENYETIAGFIMYQLRKIPKRTDSVLHAGYKFEVVDIDSYRIDQLLVTRSDTDLIT
ncbi:MAG: hemolysin family protein [Herbaspirillum sp.]